MRDEDDGDFVTEVVRGFHHSLFSEVIQRTGGLIQNQHLRVVLQRSSNTDALALAARKTHATLADGGSATILQ